MRIRLIRQDLNAPPGTAHEGIEKRAGGVLFWRVGTVIDVDRRAVQLLVGNGDAEPADDESEAAVPNWRQGRERVLLAREMLARGIDVVRLLGIRTKPRDGRQTSLEAFFDLGDGGCCAHANIRIRRYGSTSCATSGSRKRDTRIAPMSPNPATPSGES